MHSTTLDRALFVLFAVLVSGGVHAFVASWALATFPRLRKHRRAIVVGIVGLVLFGPAMRWGSLHARADGASWIFAMAMTEATLVAVATIPLAIARALVRITTREAAEPGVEAHAQTGRREALERVAGLVTLGSTAAAFGWGMARGRHAFAVEEVVVRIAGLPRALEGYTIAQVSDIHAGIFVGDRELQEGLSRVREVRPDLLVVTGDLVDFDPRHAPALARALADVAPRDGVSAILGNHDYYAGAAEVTATMRATGVDVMLNAGRLVRPGDGGGFALLGVDDMWARRAGGAGPSLDRALAMVPPDAPRILLAHQPVFVDAARGKVALQLSGHMHGGQINPGFRPADLFARYVAGRYETRGTTLWVNRGFGVAGPPVRLGAAPEVTKIVLVAA